VNPQPLASTSRATLPSQPLALTTAEVGLLLDLMAKAPVYQKGHWPLFDKLVAMRNELLLGTLDKGARIHEEIEQVMRQHPERELSRVIVDIIKTGAQNVESPGQEAGHNV
jgi:hypothetical protein